jgi:hypothetical protein
MRSTETAAELAAYIPALSAAMHLFNYLCNKVNDSYTAFTYRSSE